MTDSNARSYNVSVLNRIWDKTFFWKFFLSVILSLIIFSNDANAYWIVRIIGAGGRIDEQHGPFNNYLEASAFSVSWANLHPNDLRLPSEIEIKNDISRSSPIGLVLANATTQIDSLMNQIRDIGSNSGMEFPDSGMVLNEYKQSIEQAYENANTLKKGAEISIDESTNAIFDKLDKTIQEGLFETGSLMLKEKQLSFENASLEDSRTNAIASQQPVSKILSSIANAKDPNTVISLTEEIRSLEKSGTLRLGVIAEGEYRFREISVQDTSRSIDSLRKSVEENGRTQLEIVNRIKEKLDPRQPYSIEYVINVGSDSSVQWSTWLPYYNLARYSTDGYPGKISKTYKSLNETIDIAKVDFALRQRERDRTLDRVGYANRPSTIKLRIVDVNGVEVQFIGETH